MVADVSCGALNDCSQFEIQQVGADLSSFGVTSDVFYNSWLKFQSSSKNIYWSECPKPSYNARPKFLSSSKKNLSESPEPSNSAPPKFLSRFKKKSNPTHPGTQAFLEFLTKVHIEFPKTNFKKKAQFAPTNHQSFRTIPHQICLNFRHNLFPTNHPQNDNPK